MKTKNISKFVLKFIQENKDKNKLVEEWNSEKNLVALQSLFKKKVKDENKPKRGKSSYLHFCDDYRGSVKENFPTYTNKQILNHLGMLWKNLKEENPKLHEKYENIAKNERDRYKEKMNVYKSSFLDTENVQEHKTIPDLNSEDIKLILSIQNELENKNTEEKVIEEKVIETSDEKGFARFLKKRKNKFIDEYPELDSDKIFAKMKKKWASFSDEKKQKYIK